MILFHNESTIKDEISQNVIIFSYSQQCRFSYKGKAYKIKFRFGVYAFQDPPLCSSTHSTP
jgi:hypothetical protein